MEEKKGIDISSSVYKEIACGYCYVDKTLFIRDLLRNKIKVNLITRPRRFGKSLNMSMLQTFFEKTEKDTSVYFRDKKIWKEDKKYTSEQGKYPVIYISFLNASRRTWEKTLNQIENFIANEFDRHPELKTSDKVGEKDLMTYNAIIKKTADEDDYVMALDTLERMLYKHYGIEPIVLIDEYDAPMQNGYAYGYYDEAEDFMKGFFSNGLKDKSDLDFAVLTGVLPVAKGSAYSGFNNPKVCSILDDRFSEYFGFTRDEVGELLDYYGYSDKLDEVLEWYDGYNFGGTEIFNPLSVLEYIESGCKAKKYWVNTSNNSILSDVLSGATEDVADKLAALVRGETIECVVREDITYSNLKGDADNIFAILLMSGYLKVVKELPKENAADPDRYELAIANNEIMGVFVDEIISKLHPVNDSSILKKIWDDVEARRVNSLEDNLGEFLLCCAGYFDSKESFYQGLCLGLCAYMTGSHIILSNRESGKGRYDLTLEPKDKSSLHPAVIIEIESLRQANKKMDTDKTETNLRAEAESALDQIDDTLYDTDLKNRGCKDIIKVGIAFLGKDVAVAMR